MSNDDKNIPEFDFESMPHANSMKGIVVDAQYHETGIPEYDENPLISALGALVSNDEIIERIHNFPDYDESQREIPDHKRFHLIQMLFYINLVTSRFLHLWNTISILIRRGYIPRNPNDIKYWRQVDSQAPQMRQRFAQKMAHFIRSSVLMTSIVGLSGAGKSTAIQTLLSQFPQVIRHREFKNERFSFTQLVYLYVETPPNGSLKQMCLEILRSIDDALGTNYYDLFGRNGKSSTDHLLSSIARVASLHTIGLIVIDEVQNLNAASSGGREAMMNFFVKLSNVLNLPTVLIGTPAIRESLGKEFRMGRRFAGQGDIIFDNFKNNREWRAFVSGFWRFQYTRKKSVLTDEIIKAFHHHSAGIIDIFVKLFVLSQVRAITSGVEEITPEIIKSVSHDYLKSLEPALDALRSNDVKKMNHFRDISTINVQAHIQDQIMAAHKEAMAKYHQKMAEKTAIVEDLSGNDENSGNYDNQGEPPSKATASTAPLNINEVVPNPILETLTDSEWEQFDLKAMAKRGSEKGITAYEALKQAGLIGSPLEILEYDK